MLEAWGLYDDVSACHLCLQWCVLQVWYGPDLIFVACAASTNGSSMLQRAKIFSGPLVLASPPPPPPGPLSPPPPSPPHFERGKK